VTGFPVAEHARWQPIDVQYVPTAFATATLRLEAVQFAVRHDLVGADKAGVSHRRSESVDDGGDAHFGLIFLPKDWIWVIMSYYK
jgi:hypothetical protein